MWSKKTGWILLASVLSIAVICGFCALHSRSVHQIELEGEYALTDGFRVGFPLKTWGYTGFQDGGSYIFSLIDRNGKKFHIIYPIDFSSATHYRDAFLNTDPSLLEGELQGTPTGIPLNRSLADPLIYTLALRDGRTQVIGRLWPSIFSQARNLIR
jgi:hypothetical protein